MCFRHKLYAIRVKRHPFQLNCVLKKKTNSVIKYLSLYLICINLMDANIILTIDGLENVLLDVPIIILIVMKINTIKTRM